MTRKSPESSEGDENNCLKDKIFEEVNGFLKDSMTKLGYKDPALEAFALTVVAKSFQHWYERHEQRVNPVSSNTFREFYQGKPDVVLKQLLAGYSLEAYLKVCMGIRGGHSGEHISTAKTDPIELRNAKTDPIGLRNAKTDPVRLRNAKTDPIELRSAEPDPVEGLRTKTTARAMRAVKRRAKG